jgi:uncharacterized surface protein with fasciclin (FAS1) repeats
VTGKSAASSRGARPEAAEKHRQVTMRPGSEVQVNGAHVRRADTVATNGIIHEIDAVITPKQWQLSAAAA